MANFEIEWGMLGFGSGISAKNKVGPFEIIRFTFKYDLEMY